MKRKSVSAALVLSAWLWSAAQPAAAPDEDPPSAVEPADMDLEQLRRVQVSIATGLPTEISRAPAVADVITAEQIELMGAASLDEVLETVAGIHVVPSSETTLDSVHSIRGIQSATNSQTLIMINGIPLKTGLLGAPPQAFDLPVASIARIEIVRGPGSAVYGADAFAGVIDVITKGARDIPVPTVVLRGGSFGSRGFWFEHGGNLGGWEVAFTFDYRKSDGDSGRVLEVDQQTAFDLMFGTNASNAPGPLATDYEALDAVLDLRRGDWLLRAHAWERDEGVGDGVAKALDPSGRTDAEFLLLEVRHDHETRSQDWRFRHRLSHLRIDQQDRYTIFPAGALLPIGSDGNLDLVNPVNLVSFPDGVIGEPGDVENITTFDVAAVWSGVVGHRVRANLGGVRTELDANSRQNFGPGVIDGTQLVVDGTLTDVTDTPFTFLEDQERDQWYVSLQDEWKISPAWNLTVGARYDRYSDFGGTFNPRVALVWTPAENFSGKLLFGSGFRAPDLGLLFLRNNPAAIGNPDLQPEEIDTYELAVDYQPRPGLRGRLSLFRYEAERLIATVPLPGSTATSLDNIADQSGCGYELEVDWEGDRGAGVRGYIAQQTADRTASPPVGEAPKWQAFLAPRVRFGQNWRLYAQLNWIGDRERSPGDPRPDPGDYAILGAKLSRELPKRGMTLSLIGHNLLDEDGREPAGQAIPGDYPISGRALLAEIRYRLR